MKTPFILVVLCMHFSILAQRTGDLTIYSNTGKQFYVILNGIRQNTTAETNVMISGLTDQWYSCRIIAEDKSFDIEKNVGVKRDSTVTYRIVKKRKKYKLKYYNEQAKKDVQKTDDQVYIAYQRGNSTQNSQSDENTRTDNPPTDSQPAPDEADEAEVTISFGEGCDISPEEFEALKNEINEAAFSEDKMTIAAEAAKKTCFELEQISQLASLFEFSNERLTFIKMTYLNCLNQAEFIQLKSLFTFSSDQKELEEFIRKQQE